MKIINNFLKETEFNKIKLGITDQFFPWYLQDGVVTPKDNHTQFCHTFYAPKLYVNSPYFNLIVPILEKLKIKSLIRIKANLICKNSKIIEHGYHTDFDYNNTTAIFYINTNNGYTKFKNKKIVVKTIDKNDKGDITINGKPLLRFRILKEDKYRLLRREGDMKHRIDNQLMMSKLQNDLYFVPLEHLILHIADNVAIEMSNESNLGDDEYITFRNQIKQYIRNNFYEYIKKFWESNQL